jgi:hypothetical protein
MAYQIRCTHQKLSWTTWTAIRLLWSRKYTACVDQKAFISFELYSFASFIRKTSALTV